MRRKDVMRWKGGGAVFSALCLTSPKYNERVL